MNFCRFLSGNEGKWGIVENDFVREIFPNPFSEFTVSKTSVPLAQTKLLTPCVPSKIVAVGINYKKHAEEMKLSVPQEPVIFLKPNSAVIGPEEFISYPEMSAQVDYEAELAVVIGKRTRNILQEEAHKYILGYTCLNDVTARDLQKKDGQWTRAKSFDTFAPVGPWIVSGLDVSDLKIESYLNDERKQSGRTSDMIFSVPILISFISKIMTLEPGDIVTTGTPSGIGPMKLNDTIEVKIEGIGTLKNTVRGICR